MKTKQVKKIIRKNIAWWVHWTGLGYWHIQVVFKNTIKKRPGNLWLCGNSQSDWRYQTGYITFYPKAMRHLDPEEIEAAVIHELIHILVNEMQASGFDHEERVVTQLQKAFSWVKDADKRKP